MASNATIVLADGKGTPENHNYDPIRIDGGTSLYRNLTDQSFRLGQEQLSFALSENTERRKVVVKLTIPRVVEEEINGVTQKKVADQGAVFVTVLVPNTWDTANVTDLRVLGSNALKNALILDAIDNGAYVW